MQTIFLDIDGVLHPFNSPSSPPSVDQISGENLFCWAPLLADILGTADAQIVIHSTRRHRYSLAAIRDQFPESLRSRVGGCTAGMARLDGILQYVAEHGITDFLVLDDIADFFPPDWPHLLLCAGEVGISEPRVLAGIRDFLAAARPA